MEEIQSVKYIYKKEYKWEELEKDEKIVPKSILTEGQDKDYHFKYNYEFCYDGKYKSFLKSIK